MHHEIVAIEKERKANSLAALREQARDWVLSDKKRNPAMYPSEKEVEDRIQLLSPGGEIVSEASHIATIEQIRDEAFQKSPHPSRVRTDVFVFSKGNPNKREITKVGGLPYWPKSRPWPGSSENPLTFIAQICFLDSVDIVGNRPGDILLIFGNDQAIDGMEPLGLHFEWEKYPASGLVSKADVSRLQRAPLYGSIHRTFDYPDSHERFRDQYSQWYNLAEIQGTKIGGVPNWVQSEEDLPGKFLCTLGSTDTLMWGDVGSLYMFLEPNGKINAAIQCY